MTHTVINTVLAVSVWMFLLLGVMSQCFVDSNLIMNVLR